MKGGQNLRNLQQVRKEAEPEVKKQPCVVCEKELSAPYGRHNFKGSVVWSCSGKCERLFIVIKEKEHVCKSG